MITATATEAMIAPIIMIGSTQIGEGALEQRRSRWRGPPNAPIMKTSPWAKLMSWTMP